LKRPVNQKLCVCMCVCVCVCGGGNIKVHDFLPPAISYWTVISKRSQPVTWLFFPWSRVDCMELPQQYWRFRCFTQWLCWLPSVMATRQTKILHQSPLPNHVTLT